MIRTNYKYDLSEVCAHPEHDTSTDVHDAKNQQVHVDNAMNVATKRRIWTRERVQTMGCMCGHEVVYIDEARLQCHIRGIASAIYTLSSRCINPAPRAHRHHVRIHCLIHIARSHSLFLDFGFSILFGPFLPTFWPSWTGYCLFRRFT